MTWIDIFVTMKLWTDGALRIDAALLIYIQSSLIQFLNRSLYRLQFLDMAFHFLWISPWASLFMVSGLKGLSSTQFLGTLCYLAELVSGRIEWGQRGKSLESRNYRQPQKAAFIGSTHNSLHCSLITRRQSSRLHISLWCKWEKVHVNFSNDYANDHQADEGYHVCTQGSN